MKVTACLNGTRTKADHPAVPVTPEEIADAARAAVVAGAGDVHVHPKTSAGADTLEPPTVEAVLVALRAAVPGVAVSLTTGAWAAVGVEERLAAVRAWPLRPESASVNWHEAGAEELAEELRGRGVVVEAGLWTPEAVRRWRASSWREKTGRVLLEVTEDDEARGVVAARELVAALGPRPGVEVQLHGEGRSAWPVLREAVRLGLATRIGLEDTLTRADGTFAQDNQELVRGAFRQSGH